MNNRTAIFIDGGYLNNVMKEFPGRTISFERLSNTLAGRDLFRTYYYNSMPFCNFSSSEEEIERFKKAQQFYTILKEIPNYEVRLGKLIKHLENGKESYLQKQVDILLAIDLISLSLKGKITKAIIISGDSDFVPIIKIAKNEGITTHLYHGKSYAQDLWEICDIRSIIGEYIVSRSERNIHSSRPFVRHLQAQGSLANSSNEEENKEETQDVDYNNETEPQNNVVLG